MAPVSVALNAAYRARLAAGVNALLARLAVAWATGWDAESPLFAAGALGDITAIWAEGTQAWAARETVEYLRALTGAGGLDGFRVPAGLVGTSASGGSLADAAGLAPSVWLARILAGASPDEAAGAVAEWLARLASSEPYRVANATALHNAIADPRLTGRFNRVTSTGACPFCTLIADRGYISARAGFAAHAHCRCTVEPEVSSYATSAAARRRAAAAPAQTGCTMSTPPAPPAPPAPTATPPPAPPAPPPSPPAPPPAPPAPPSTGTGDDNDPAKLRAALDDERKQRKAAEDKLDAMQRAALTDHERAVAEARDAGKAEAAAGYAEQLAGAEFRAVAAGRLADPDKALARLDLRKLVKDGAPDKAAITAAVDDLASVPAPGGRVPPGPRGGQEPGTGDFLRDAMSGRARPVLPWSRCHGRDAVAAGSRIRGVSRGVMPRPGPRARCSGARVTW